MLHGADIHTAKRTVYQIGLLKMRRNTAVLKDLLPKYVLRVAVEYFPVPNRWLKFVILNA